VAMTARSALVAHDLTRGFAAIRGAPLSLQPAQRSGALYR
jgi:hypothetical protein